MGRRCNRIVVVSGRKATGANATNYKIQHSMSRN